jgi:hypothetical protein
MFRVPRTTVFIIDDPSKDMHNRRLRVERTNRSGLNLGEGIQPTASRKCGDDALSDRPRGAGIGATHQGCRGEAHDLPDHVVGRYQTD